MIKAARLLLLAGALVAATGTAASTDAADRPAPCDRQCLIEIGEATLHAMVAGTPDVDPISPDVRYTENGQELRVPDGLWRTLSKANDYRLRVVDPQTGMIGIFSVVEENGAPVILSTRLAVRNRMVTEIETTVARTDSAISAGNSAAMGPRPLDLKQRPAFDQVLAQSERRPRWKLIEIANTYFRALENNNGTDHVPPFAPDCHRIENGMATTNRPLGAGAERGAGNMPCAEAFRLGYYHNDTRLRGMRFLAVDEERGLVFVNGFFDHDAVAREYKLNDGRSVKVDRTAPWTWEISEVFKIKDGQIWQVEAVLLSVPYGMKSGWDNGWKMPSYQEELERTRL